MNPGDLQQVTHEFFLWLLRSLSGRTRKAIYVSDYRRDGATQGTTVRVRTGRMLTVDEVGSLSAQSFRDMREFGFMRDEIKEVVLDRQVWLTQEVDMRAYSSVDEFSHMVLAPLANAFASQIQWGFGATLVTADRATGAQFVERVESEGISIVGVSEYDVVQNREMIAFGMLYGLLDGAVSSIQPSHREQIRLLKDAIARWESQMAKVQQRLAA